MGVRGYPRPEFTELEILPDLTFDLNLGNSGIHI